MNAAEITLVPTMAAPEGAAIVPAESLRIGTGRVRRFVGREHGAGISYFYVDHDPGQGPGLHWHPYPETWVVLEGTVEFTMGELRLVGGEGETATVPTGVWHRFENIGDDRLLMLCIHASDVIIQTWAEED